METFYSPRIRTERLIVVGRILLAVLSLIVIWLDPYESSKYSYATHIMLSAYLGYSLLLTPLVWLSSVRVNTAGFMTHIIDIIIFTSLVYFTGGIDSPFFAYFIISIFCAALRWQEHGTLWTTLTYLCLFIGMGLSMEIIHNARNFELNHFIIRCFYLAGVASLLVYLTAYDKRVRTELAKLNDWPNHTDPSSPPQTVTHNALTYAIEVIDAPRLLMVWEEREEPVCHIIYLSAETFQWQKMPPNSYQPLVAKEFKHRDFFCQNAASASADVILTANKGFRHQSGSPLDAELIAHYHIRQVIALELSGQSG